MAQKLKFTGRIIITTECTLKITLLLVCSFCELFFHFFAVTPLSTKIKEKKQKTMFKDLAILGEL